MRTLENKKFTIKLGDNEAPLSYAELCKEAIKAVPQGGFNLDDYAKRVKILEVLEDAGDTIELEDDHHTVLVSSLSNFKPAVLDKNIAEWIEAVKRAEDAGEL